MAKGQSFNLEDFWYDTTNWAREQPRWRFALAIAVVGFIVYSSIISPKDLEYMQAVEIEVEIAQTLCENSRDWAINNVEKLKINNNRLDFIKVDGVLPEFKLIETPRVMLLSNGFHHKNSQIEFYCTFDDPRGRVGKLSNSYFYDYFTSRWVDRRISRL